MSSYERSERAVDPASLYATRHPMLFLAFTPVVLCAVAILGPLSVAGLLIIIPGLSGFAGLIGLTMAWLALVWPGIAVRRGGTILFLLVAALPAIGLGLSTFLVARAGSPNHAVDPMMALGPATAIFAVLAFFFMAGVLVSSASTSASAATYVRRWKVAGSLVVLLTLPLPLGCLLVAGGYGKSIRHEQGAEADVLSRRALAAIDAYRSAHAGALPPDNASAGLPAPEAMSDTYVASVTVAKGEVRLVYRDTVLSNLFGAGAADVSLTFTPDRQDSGLQASAPGRWSCMSSGYRLEGDMPLLLDGRCR